MDDKGCYEETSGQQEQTQDTNPFNFTPQLIHLHRSHEWFEDGDIQRHMYLQDLYIPEEEKAAIRVSEFGCHISGCSAVHSTLEEYEHHYNSLHRHVCSSCHRALPTARLLDIHIQEWHDSLFTILAQRQNMYQCLVEGCEDKFKTSVHRKDHLIRIHKYPPDFRFDKKKKDSGKKEKKHKQQNDTAMEVVNTVRESAAAASLSPKPEEMESMETHSSREDDEAKLDTFTAVDISNRMSAEPQKPQYSYRIPANVCFGHGSIRGFRGRRGRRK
ncbi:zinc finger protein 511 [Synchiropus splendidus]|uniref:zinc finger protein 511 n=1 Tax=Synchiropus splendidus TaxID=270530 RepID=UPI00237DB0A9|nr:zinc finger protein 511 [Synchiropus splendidus]